MLNNDILRRIRYIFNFSDSKMVAIFDLAEYEVTRGLINEWLKKEDDSNFLECSDYYLAVFLNGFIIERRGKKEGPLPKAESKLTNNIIIRKLKIALNLKSEDILVMLHTANLRISKHELSAFFRKPDHKHYKECKDQILRKFLNGVEERYHKKAK